MTIRSLALGLGAALFVASAVAAQQAPNKPPQDKPQTPQDVSLTGCLTQGSSPAVFVLNNVQAGAGSTTRWTSYRLAKDKEDIDFAKDINHEVTVTGTAEDKAPLPPGQKAQETELP